MGVATESLEVRGAANEAFHWACPPSEALVHQHHGILTLRLGYYAIFYLECDKAF